MMTRKLCYQKDIPVAILKENPVWCSAEYRSPQLCYQLSQLTSDLDSV